MRSLPHSCRCQEQKPAEFILLVEPIVQGLELVLSTAEWLGSICQVEILVQEPHVNVFRVNLPKVCGVAIDEVLPGVNVGCEAASYATTDESRETRARTDWVSRPHRRDSPQGQRETGRDFFAVEWQRREIASASTRVHTY